MIAKVSVTKPDGEVVEIFEIESDEVSLYELGDKVSEAIERIPKIEARERGDA